VRQPGFLRAERKFRSGTFGAAFEAGEPEFVDFRSAHVSRRQKANFGFVTKPGKKLR
jgi:hypothetical protein